MQIKRKWLMWVGAVVFVALLPWLYSAGSYALATHQYETLVAKKPTSKSDVEGLLFLCLAQKVDVTNSLWSKSLALEPGEVCWQYKVLWHEPIDVVYDSEGKVKYILPSFE